MKLSKPPRQRNERAGWSMFRGAAANLFDETQGLLESSAHVLFLMIDGKNSQMRPVFGSIALFLLGAVVPGALLFLIGAFDEPGPRTERMTSAHMIEHAIARLLSAILILLSAGVLGIAMAVLSLLRREGRAGSQFLR